MYLRSVPSTDVQSFSFSVVAKGGGDKDRKKIVNGYFWNGFHFLYKKLGNIVCA